MGDYYDDDDDAGGIEADMDEFEDSIDESEEEPESEEEDELEGAERVAEEEDDAVPPADIIDLEEAEVERTEVREFAILGPDIHDEDHRMVQIIPADDRITSDIIQLPEMTEAIGIRISQIENGMPVMPGVNVEGMTSAIEMAQMEFLENKNPLILRRILQQKGNLVIVEDWEVCKMAHPPRARYYLAALKRKDPPIDVGSLPMIVREDAPIPVPVTKRKVAAKAKAKAKSK